MTSGQPTGCPLRESPLSEWRSQQQRFGPHLSWEFPSHLLTSVECSRDKSPRLQCQAFRSKLARQIRPRPRGYAWRSVRYPRAFPIWCARGQVADLVECGFMWECSKGIYRDFAPVRKTLNVAIQFVERRARDVQCSERCADVKARNRRNVSFFSLGFALAQTNKPETGRHSMFVILSAPPRAPLGCYRSVHF